MPSRRFPPLRPILGPAILLALAMAPAAQAQAPGQADSAERAGFTMRLGTDTVAVEVFTRTGDRLEGTRVLRVPRTSVLRYSALLRPDGTVSRFEVSSTAGTGPDSSRTQTSTVAFDMDSVRVTLEAGDSARSYAMNPVLPTAAPMAPFTFALYEQVVRQALARGGDSAAVALIYPGVLSPLATSVRRIAPDSVAIDFFGAPMLARIDSAGRILGVDARATTQKFVVTRGAGVDIEKVARAFAAAEEQAGPAGPLSSRDTVTATVGAAEISIDYGRPRRRGRTIMGGVVPLGQVWRTGANAATGLVTSGNLMIGGVSVPAGSYTLYTLPTAGGATLIVNRQTGQWGTEYDAEQDLVRIPLEQESLDEPVEQFTIAIEPAADGATLSLAWGRTRWTVPISAS